LGLFVPKNDFGLRAAADCDVLLVAEGEPDWLSLHDATRGHAGVLGVCDVARGWRPEWSDLLRRPGRVLVTAHAKDDAEAGKGGALAKQVGAELVRLRGADEARRRFLWHAFPEADDANDHHRRGELAPLLQRLLADPTAPR
jgi:hypothetical protein